MLFYLVFFIHLRLQEVKAQPQNLLLDAVFDDPWTAALRYNINILIWLQAVIIQCIFNLLGMF